MSRITTLAGKLLIMNHSDKEPFKKLMNGIAEALRVEKPGTIGLKLYFSTLAEYSIDQVVAAAESHLKDKKSGQFYPKPADFIKHIEGEDLKADMIVALARLANTPLGCLCRIQIGTWDLDNQNDFYLRQRAEECLQLLPEWKARHLAGSFSKHEKQTMLKYNVDPESRLAIGSDIDRKRLN